MNDTTSTIAAPQFKVIDLTICGKTPLIMSKFSEKAKQQMLEKQTNTKKIAKRAPKDPDKQYRESIYYLPDGKTVGMPAICFKKAAVNACRTIDGLPMTRARQLFFAYGTEDFEMVSITGQPTMREDMVRLESGVADVRFRAEFKEWSTRVRIKFLTNNISAEAIVNLMNLAGTVCGIGERRPEKEGNTFGTFQVTEFKEI